MRRYIHITLLVLFGGLVLTGCDPRDPAQVPPPTDPDPKTFIMFGNIRGFGESNIPDAELAVAQGALIKGQRVLIYHDKRPQNELYELVQDRSQKNGFLKKSIKLYDRAVSSLNPERMRLILDDAIAAAPANHYALSVGVHGAGWIPIGLTLSQHSRMRDGQFFEYLKNPLTRSMNEEIENVDFAAVFEGLDFDFVVMDICFMGSIESIYDMRKIAKHLIVSPAEIMMAGFPFHKLINRIFDDWSDLEGVCNDFAVNYNSLLGYPSATIALVKTSELEALAQTVRAIRMDDYVSVDPVSEGLQYYENMRSHIFHDLDQYIKAWSNSEVLYNSFSEQLAKTVIHKAHSEKFYSGYGGGGSVNVSYFSGLSAYVPLPSRYPNYYAAYQNTAWYKAVYVD